MGSAPGRGASSSQWSRIRSSSWPRRPTAAMTGSGQRDHAPEGQAPRAQGYCARVWTRTTQRGVRAIVAQIAADSVENALPILGRLLDLTESLTLSMERRRFAPRTAIHRGASLSGDHGAPTAQPRPHRAGQRNGTHRTRPVQGSRTAPVGPFSEEPRSARAGCSEPRESQRVAQTRAQGSGTKGRLPARICRTVRIPVRLQRDAEQPVNSAQSI